MSRSLSVMPDGSQALVIPSVVSSVLLTTSAQAVAVPGDITHVFFSATSNFVAAYSSTVGGVAAAMTTASSSGAELNPSVRKLPRGGIAEISVLSSAAGGYLSISMFNSGSTST